MPRPSIEFFKPRDLGPRDWGTETLMIETDAYIGKVLAMRAGTAGGLQYHQRKMESFVLIKGTAEIDYDDGTGTLVTSSLDRVVVHVPPGATHRVRALTDCTLIEWSTPVFNDRVRCETEYGEPEATNGLPTTR